MNNNYLKYYDLETYLLETVRPRFHAIRLSILTCDTKSSIVNNDRGRQ